MPDRATSPMVSPPPASESPDLDSIASSMADNSPASPWARLIITPLTFLSFLLSLSLIDSYTTSRLAPQSHSSLPSPTLLQRITNLTHRLLFKQSPPAHAKAGVRDKNPRWHEYYHTHQRKMMAMEVDDAFRIRRWVLWGMGAAMLVLCSVGFVLAGKIGVVVVEWLSGVPEVP